MPDLTDDIRESCTAQLIRLMFNYGRMLGSDPRGRKLVLKASESVSHFASLQPVSSRTAGYYCAAASFADPQCAFAVGPRAQSLADQLYRLRPNRLITAVQGSVRPDLSKRKPGLYLANGSITAGPYTVDQAAKLIQP
jgi:hypothetical protein